MPYVVHRACHYDLEGTVCEKPSVKEGEVGSIHCVYKAWQSVARNDDSQECIEVVNLRILNQIHNFYDNRPKLCPQYH